MLFDYTLDEVQRKGVEVVQGGLQEGAIDILIKDTVVAFRSVPVEFDDFLRRTFSVFYLLVCFVYPFLKVVLADRQIDDRLSEIIDSEGWHMEDFFHATAFLLFLEGGQR